MKQHIPTIADLLACTLGIGEAKQITLSLAGNTQESDWASSVSKTIEAATKKASAIYVHEIVTAEPTATSCLSTGSHRQGMVFVKAECRIHAR
jgi:hypothetical protein